MCLNMYYVIHLAATALLRVKSVLLKQKSPPGNGPWALQSIPRTIFISGPNLVSAWGFPPLLKLKTIHSQDLKQKLVVAIVGIKVSPPLIPKPGQPMRPSDFSGSSQRCVYRHFEESSIWYSRGISHHSG